VFSVRASLRIRGLKRFLVAEAVRPVQAQACFTVLPTIRFMTRPPGRLLDPGRLSACGSRSTRPPALLHPRSARGDAAGEALHRSDLRRMGLPSRRAATNRREPGPAGASAMGKVPIASRRVIAPKCGSAAPCRGIPAYRPSAAASPPAWRFGFHLAVSAPATARTSSRMWRAQVISRRYRLYRDDPRRSTRLVCDAWARPP